MISAVFVPDIHYPYHDQLSLNALFGFIWDMQPTCVIQLGDLIDCYSVSDFARNPKRILSLQEELDAAKQFWPTIKRISPKSERVQILGNHEHRLAKYLCAHPEISSLKALDIRGLLDLPDDVQLVQYGDSYDVGGLIATHGVKIGKFGGYSAAAELQSRWASGVSGHTHRVGQTYYTSSKATYSWTECGYLGTTDWRQFEYPKSPPNWQQGFAYAYLTPHKESVHPVHIEGHTFIVNGKLYGPEFDPSKRKR